MSSQDVVRTMAFLTHNWGVNQVTHILVSMVNAFLQSMGIITWFDEDRMVGEIRDTMAKGIENTRCVVVFITPTYRDKVNGTEDRDNCRYEFKYACRKKGPQKMIPVILDKSMLNSNIWGGIL